MDSNKTYRYQQAEYEIQVGRYSYNQLDYSVADMMKSLNNWGKQGYKIIMMIPAQSTGNNIIHLLVVLEKEVKENEMPPQ